MSLEIAKIKYNKNEFSYNISHFHQHENVLNYLREAIIKAFNDLDSESIGTVIKKTVDLEKIIGKTYCVPLIGNENIFYAQRLGRKTLTKFVKNTPRPDCSSLTFVISKKDKNKYKILTAYIGYQAEKEPLDPSIRTREEFEISKEFWSKHALVQGSQKIYDNTIVFDCPWNTFEERIRVNLDNSHDINNKIEQIREKAKNFSKSPSINNDL